MRSWCRYYGYIFNPKALQNGQKRISKKIDGNTKDMIYVQTKMEQIDPLNLSEDSGFTDIPDEVKPF